MKKLSVVLATRNEEANLERCLQSVKAIADEIIVFDEHSTDKTREIAKKFKAKVYEVDHEPIFHITKQKAIDAATGDWILQLDADEVVTPELAREIQHVTELTYEEIKNRRPESTRSWALFQRHAREVESRGAQLGKETGEVVAFFIPRRNLFIGEPLIYGGRYPDGVIRLFRKGRARLPGKNVHEQMLIEGEIAWIFSDLLHNDSPTLEKYINRLNRYTELRAEDLNKDHVQLSLLGILTYTFWYMPLQFVLGYFRFRGYKNGMRGFLWAALSASQYPLAYYKYYLNDYNEDHINV